MQSESKDEVWFTFDKDIKHDKSKLTGLFVLTIKWSNKMRPMSEKIIGSTTFLKSKNMFVFRPRIDFSGKDRLRTVYFRTAEQAVNYGIKFFSQIEFREK